MPTVNMTDADWAAAYSQLVQASFQANQVGVPFQQLVIAIPVTFTASEVFTNYQIAIPFGAPGSATWGSPQPAWTPNADLLLSHYEMAGNPGDPPGVPGPVITGENTSGSPLDTTFYVAYVLTPWGH